jgi:amino acid transporter
MTDAAAPTSPEAQTHDPAFAAKPKRHVSVLYVVMLAVAMVVGAGIFRSPSVVADSSGGAFWFFGSWVIGGLVSLVGALCYAELAAAFPSAGGDYHFLKTAYGRFGSFLFAWARFAVINTGSLAFLGFVLGDYANVVAPLGPKGPAIYALAAVLLMTAFNLRSFYENKAADYAMTGLEIGGVVIITIAGVVLVVTGKPPLAPDGPASLWPPAGYGSALVFAMLAFGGWSEVATLSAEVKDGKHGMVRALVLSIIVITLLYLGVNWALWRGLGMEGLANSTAPASDLIGLAFGSAAGVVTAVAISLATITSINATIIVGARTTYAAARDTPALDRLGRWSEGRGIPLRAILAQSAIGVLLVGYGAASYDGFAALVDYTAPVFWIFMILSGAAVIVLRIKRPEVERPFKVPLYPLTPIIFCASSGLVLWSSLEYVGQAYGRIGPIAGLVVLGLGAVVYGVLTLRKPGGA